MKTTTSSPLRTLVVGSRPLRFEKGWHVKTTLRDVFHFTFAGLLLIALTACGGGSSSPTPMTPSKPMTSSKPMTPSTYTQSAARSRDSHPALARAWYCRTTPEMISRFARTAHLPSRLLSLTVLLTQ
jgi:hypothetical protein